MLYAQGGLPCFPFYWVGNPLSITGFNFNKLDELEVLSLEILDSFKMMKVKELLLLSDEELLVFLGNCLPFISVAFHYYRFDIVNLSFTYR